MRKLTLLAAAAAGGFSAPAAAWNDRGHMIVAAKAWQELTPQTRHSVGRLLRHNPMYASWTRSVPHGQKARAAFIHSATWPDHIKGAPGYFPDALPNPNSARNIGFADCAQHSYWHFNNRPFSPDGTPTRPAGTPNAGTQIAAFRAAISDPATSDEVKAYDIGWLVHMVGDIHQPLHAVQRFVAGAPGGDLGANNVTYCLTAGCRTGSPLHSFWDGAFGRRKDLAGIVAYAAQLPAAPGARAGETSIETWMDESFALARDKAYAAPVGTDLSGQPFLLTPAYRREAVATAISQAALGGARLARLLNGAGLTVRGDAVQPRTCGGRRS
jgi:hypothetical protein